ncbi:M20 aminoacylase family protein [Variovorax terrae]|uniref:M20 family metallopeptidase n=1 Tax=Variovorax terrae TaxID=2923278 RepID=A0A9X1W080_9BURK|nr:M20 aminoacylase family protein [Variovorax terrae]MCJ0766149.1 M20 family metallopeptidase [Variovorax terrae]
MTETAIPEAILARESEMRALRQDLHAHPELGFKESRTSNLVAERLRFWGYEVHRGLGGTGVVGTLTCGSSERRLGLRADMDALPIQEAGDRPYRSLHVGCMHACGHDGHTTMLLAAACHLAATRDFDGTLHLIFQPAEEGLGGGRRMIEDGLFDLFPCDAVFAMHNVPGLPAGRFGFRAGPFTASADTVVITVHGRGGHAAMPAETVDPVVVGSAIVMALQTVVSRNVASTDSAVVTVGAFQAGQAANVIPATASLQLTVRTHDAALRERVLRRVHEIAHAQAESFGARAEVVHTPVYPVLINHERETEFARRVALDWLGPEGLIADLPLQTGAEDFAYMLAARPGCYFVIGNGAGEGGAGAQPLHSPAYDFNDACLPIGAAFWARLARRYLGTEPA